MAVLSKSTKHAFFTEGPSLTEQEHLKSCDINLMLKKAMAGQPFRGSSAASRYGVDDMNRTLLSHILSKKELEQALAAQAAETELSESELASIPTEIKQKFKFRKKKTDTGNVVLPKNDDKTTKNGDPTPTPQSSTNSTPGKE